MKNPDQAHQSPHAALKHLRSGLIATVIAGGTILGATQFASAASVQTDPTSTVAAADPTSAAATDPTPEDCRAQRGELREERQADREADHQALADLLGLDVDALRSAVEGGSTLAQVAEVQGVERSAVVDLLVQQGTERIARGVENGNLTDEQAATMTAELPDRVATRVDEGRPERGDRPDRGGRGRRGGDRADAPREAPPTTEG